MSHAESQPLGSPDRQRIAACVVPAKDGPRVAKLPRNCDLRNRAPRRHVPDVVQPSRARHKLIEIQSTRAPRPVERSQHRPNRPDTSTISAPGSNEHRHGHQNNDNLGDPHLGRTVTPFGDVAEPRLR